MTTDFDQLDGLILLELFKIMEDRPWRVQSWLLDFARPGQEPGDHDSYNPVRRIAGWLGCKIQDRLVAGCRERARLLS